MNKKNLLFYTWVKKNNQPQKHFPELDAWLNLLYLLGIFLPPGLPWLVNIPL